MAAPMREGEHLWFLDSLVCVHVASAAGVDGLSVLEHQVPFGNSPPLHIHRTEDEVFHLVEGELRLKMGDEERRVGPGQIVLAPKGTPHTYRIESRTGGRLVTVTAHGDFERFIRAVGRRAERIGLPTAAGRPTPEAVEALAAVARKHGIEFVGPPLD